MIKSKFNLTNSLNNNNQSSHDKNSIHSEKEEYSKNSSYTNSNIIIPSPDNNSIINNPGDYIPKEKQPQKFTNEDISKKPKGQGFKTCSELTQPGKDGEGNIKMNQDTPLMC